MSSRLLRHAALTAPSRTARHRRVRRRSLRVALAMLIAGTGTLVALGTPSAGAAASTVIEPAATCRRFDPNLGSGACLRYQSRSGIAYTWLGTYRATDGVAFYCIDYLYDSRITASSARVTTAALRNQLDRPIGSAEVAALNALISARAPGGSAGSWAGDAAIALIIREVMSDGIRGDGTVVYPPGLKAGGVVKPVTGGMPSAILGLAQQWWRDASASRGPWTVRLEASTPGTSVPLGTKASYRLRVISAAGHDVPGAVVTLACTGPVTCPSRAVTAAVPAAVAVQPTALGDFVITATVQGPSAQGRLLLGSWSPHGGATARNNGVQRGWIVTRVPATAQARGAAQVVKAVPRVLTAAQPTALTGAALTDLVTVSDLPPEYDHAMSATLYGPFSSPPSSTSCTADKAVGTVSARVAANGSLRTPPVTAAVPGFYVWRESLPGDDQTNPVQTPCGLVEETTVVSAAPAPDRPSLHTQASASRLTVPGSVFDTVSVSGLSTASIALAWTLLGPIAPGSQGCAHLDWAGAPVRASGRINAGNGTVRTPAVRLVTAGCYTFTEHSRPSSTATAADSRPGLPEETVFGRRAPLPIVPDVPTGPSESWMPSWWARHRVA